MGDWYEKQTLGLLPERAARQWGPREALAFQGTRWTFAELDARVNAVAKGRRARRHRARRPNSAVWTVSLSAAAPDTVFAASRYGYLYRSDDGGDSWRKFWREFGEVSSILWVPR